MVECCNNSGGRVALKVNGRNGTKSYSARGAFTIKPTTIETDAGANQDGTLYVTTKPVPAEAEITLSDKCGLRLEDLIGCTIDATIEIIEMGRVYLYTKARVVGRPSIKTDDGEISGLKIVSTQVTQLDNGLAA